VVRRPDGSEVVDYDSPTGKLMAPPNANFQEVYAAGARTWKWNAPQINAAVGQFGRCDFQRDAATNTAYSEYKHASN
jgi:hypothetical protein